MEFNSAFKGLNGTKFLTYNLRVTGHEPFTVSFVNIVGIPRMFVVAGSCRQPQTYVKPEAAITVLELLMMGGVSLETCWAIKKDWNNKFYYTVASCWLFLYDLYYDGLIHEYHDTCT